MVDPQRVEQARQLLQQKGYTPPQVDPARVQAARDLLAKSKLTPAPAEKKDPGVFKNLDEPAYDLTNKGLSVGNVAKSGANIFKSVLKFGKGVVQSLNPVKIAKDVKSIPSAIIDTAQSQAEADQSQKNAKILEAKVKATTGKAPVAKDVKQPSTVSSVAGGAYKTIIPPAVDKIFHGKFTEATQSVAEDPYQLAPLFLAGKGLLETKFGLYDAANPKATGTAPVDTPIGKYIDDTVSNTAKIVTDPVKSVANGVKATGNFAVSQATGLAPETIKTIKENPNSFSPSEIAKSDRSGVVSDVHNVIQKRLEDLSETGKGYQVIRDSGQVATVDQGWLSESLKKNGWSDGQTAVDANGIARPGIKPTKLANISNAEQSALQRFMDVWGGKKNLTAEEFLDGRKYLDSWSKWQSEVASTEQGKALFRELRHDFNSAARGQFKGLGDLDLKYGPEAAQLRQIQKEYLNADGTLKDSASSKIANLTNKGREQALARLEKISPGITKKIRVLKAIEDIHAASGQKVGTYTRALISGAGIATMNPAAIVTAILANPSVATQLLRAYGAFVKAGKGVVDSSINEVNKSLNSEPKVGLSIEDAGLKRKTLQTEWQRLQEAKLNTKDKAAIARYEKAQRNIDDQVSKLRR